MEQIRYAYDPRTGVLIGQTEAHPDPMAPERLLEPAFSTPTPPPASEPGHAVAMVGGRWTLVPDYRGKTWWRATVPVLITDVGDPAAMGLTAEPVLPPLPPPTSCTKLGLKRAFGDFWPTVRTAIAADPDMQEEWDLAVSVNRQDPLVKKMQAGLGLSDDQVTKLVAAANAAVA